MMDYLLRITISSHNFCITRINSRARPVIYQFIRENLLMYGPVRIPGGQYINSAVKVYSSSSADRNEIRFHINMYESFIDYLRLFHITENLMDIVTKPIVIFDEVSLPIQSHWIPKEEQKPAIEYLADNDSPNRSRILELQTGKGKAVKMTEPIKIPGGWKLMGDIKLGDFVTAKDGTPTKVTGVYPQGKLLMYTVKFADGRSLDCCAEHLWKVYYVNTSINKRWRVVDTLEVLRLISMPNPRVYIDLIDAEDCENVDFVIDPYLLGALLGDGSISSKCIRMHTPDEFIANEFRRLLPDTLELSLNEASSKFTCKCYSISRKDRTPNTNSFKKALQTFGLISAVSHQKFIPKEYFTSSKAQRLSLVQGLLDTDGTVNTVATGGAISFNSTSFALAEGLQQLIWSLGGIASISTRQTYFDYKGEKKAGRISYDVNIRYKKPSELFRLPKKKERTNDNNQHAASLKLRVMSVEPTITADAQCISVEHPDKLFVVNNFIVTHNSVTAMIGISLFSKRTAIVIKPMYIEKWIADVLKTYVIKESEIMTVSGSAQLQGLIQMGKLGILKSKFIIISNKTIQNWYKLYEQAGKETLEMGYDCLPEDFFETIRCGMRLIDEVHQDFHLNFKIDLYTNIERSISLSATMVNYDQFMERMYKIAYPIKTRFEGPPLDKYVIARELSYHIREDRKYNVTEYNSNMYSHHAFEKSILKVKDFRDNYCKLIWNTLEIGFMHNYIKGQRCLIFCSSIDMCTVVTNYMKNRYPDLLVRRYVEDDPYENLLESDIAVSTLQSAGTAHDIANLKTVVLTVAINSLQSNVQSLGRLRKLKDVNTYFFYFVCQDIPKHIAYAIDKEKMLLQRAANLIKINAPFLV